ncbi:hypothetical protein FOZ61_004664 [Perkinsus olseni]|uniref:Peptidase A1 domain-containing protein n=1 Tax=Perkinsus olseni TaxID=32597 RepID=A0A7J6LJS8_PEROL|nr:hypothetical protein FOZ61_004664 [Perkinsus olseni]
MSAVALFSLAAALQSASASLALRVPMKRNEVEMEFDGWPVRLFVDTGSDKSYLVYGGWYESIYGLGSCQYLRTGCYFCPPTNPCNLTTLLSQKIHPVHFGSGRSVDIVIRNVTMKVGEREIRNLQMGLVVGCTRTQSGLQPYALLGLSIPSRSSAGEGGAVMPPFLKQLTSLRQIPQTAFSVHASKLSVRITGQLVLGEFPEETSAMTTFPLVGFSLAKAPFAITVSEVQVRSSTIRERVRSLNLTKEQQPHEVVIDTGCSWTHVPDKFFTMVLDAIQAEVGPERVGWRSVRTQPTDVQGLDAVLKSDDCIVVHRTIVDRLPVLVFKDKDAGTFKLHLSNHVQVCDEVGWCQISLGRSFKAYPTFDAFQLGRPFFVEHDLYVNFNRGVVGIAAPPRPVVNEAVKPEAAASLRDRVLQPGESVNTLLYELNKLYFEAHFVAPNLALAPDKFPTFDDLIKSDTSDSYHRDMILKFTKVDDLAYQARIELATQSYDSTRTSTTSTPDTTPSVSTISLSDEQQEVEELRGQVAALTEAVYAGRGPNRRQYGFNGRNGKNGKGQGGKGSSSKRWCIYHKTDSHWTSECKAIARLARERNGDSGNISNISTGNYPNGEGTSVSTGPSSSQVPSLDQEDSQ